MSDRTGLVSRRSKTTVRDADKAKKIEVPVENISSFNIAEVYIALVALLVRSAVGFWGYSGMRAPPMFGDFEAQRHWMEITTGLPMGEWYFQTDKNDLLYWGLDYPPLTAYVSYLFGLVAHHVLPDLVALERSRGFETDAGKSFMRTSVLICDTFIFIPAVFVMLRHTDSKKMTWSNRQTILLMLVVQMAPPLILIDNGHFQYNGVCIGLSLWAAAMLLKGRDVFASVLFSLSLNFKQMALYYSPVFFVILLGNCWRKPTVFGGLIHLCKIGATVIITFAVMWIPFCIFPSHGEDCGSSFSQILHRLFPFARGIFEDKVSNFWYVASVVFDFRGTVSQNTLVKISFALTLALLSPTAAMLLKRRTSHESITLGLMSSSLAFFLCSFQVHEKSILLSTVPAALYFSYDPIFSSWFVLIGSFTMYPLLAKDGQVVPYFVLQFTFVALVLCFWNEREGPKTFMLQPSGYRSASSWLERLKHTFVAVSCIGMVVLHLGILFYKPPERYPDLFPALFSIFGFLNLSFVYLYAIYSLWMIP